MKRLLLLLIGLAFLFTPTPTYAHSFGKLYSLPVPLWMYLFGAAATIAVSFLIIGFFFNNQTSSFSYPVFKLPPNRLLRLLSSPFLRKFLKFVSVFLLFLTILSGLFGSNVAASNFNMTFFWIIFVLGLTYLSAVFGNIYAILNPLKILFEVYEKVTKKKVGGLLKYPKFLAYYPALIFYFLFIWVELFAKTTPQSLSQLLLIYGGLTILGGFAFGKENWFRYGEFFSVFFTLIGKLAPVEFRDGKFYLRVPFVGLLKGQADHLSQLLFIMFMLSSTAYDGFHSTVAAIGIYYPNLSNLLQPFFGDSSYRLYQSTALALGLGIFLAAYLLFLQLAKKITKSSFSLTQLSLGFSFSLIPIALAYNLAHYYTLILTDGQNLIYLISDPFGFKWNLFGTLHYRSSLAVINTTATWNFQVAFILIGHIIGVYLAHLLALRIFPNHKKAFLSGLPLLLLMIIYTLTGLWILALPISIVN